MCKNFQNTTYMLKYPVPRSQRIFQTKTSCNEYHRRFRWSRQRTQNRGAKREISPKQTLTKVTKQSGKRPTRSSSARARHTCRENAGCSHGGRSSARPSAGDEAFVLSPISARLNGPGRGTTVVIPTTRSAPLTIDFVKVRGLRLGSWWVAATKNMGHRRRRRSA